MTGEADRCTLIRVGRLINSTPAAQNRNLPHTHTAYTTTQVGRLGFTMCRALQPRYHRKKNSWPWVGGYRAHKGTACCNAPLGNESPTYRQCEQLYPKREIRVLGRWSKRKSKARQVQGPHPCSSQVARGRDANRQSGEVHSSNWTQRISHEKILYMQFLGSRIPSDYTLGCSDRLPSYT